MNAKVDPDLCIACGICPDLCPEVFELSGDIAIVIVDPVPPEAEASCREAMESCPVDAISIDE